MGSGRGGLFGGYRQQTEEERAVARLTRQKIEIVTHEAITPADAAWLAERIGGGGKLTPNQRALLAFLKAESPCHRPGAAATGGAGDSGGVSCDGTRLCQTQRSPSSATLRDSMALVRRAGNGYSGKVRQGARADAGSGGLPFRAGRVRYA